MMLGGHVLGLAVLGLDEASVEGETAVFYTYNLQAVDTPIAYAFAQDSPIARMGAVDTPIALMLGAEQGWADMTGIDSVAVLTLGVIG